MDSPQKGYGPSWKKLHAETGWWHSFELPDGSVTKGVNPLSSLRDRISQFPIPYNLKGRRVLDIGAWDGWFSFEMERRGAEVVAIDMFDSPRFRQMHSIYGSRVEYRQMDVMEIAPETVGQFDIVLFLGVLYHLKHPLMALEKVCSVTRGLAAVDSYVLRDNFDPNARPVLEFYETDEMEGQLDNWTAPNVACLMAMCRTAGFARVELRKVLDYSASLACFRDWEPASAPTPCARLERAVHNLNSGINFDTRRDEYLTCFFRTEKATLTRNEVRPRVGPYGVQPLYLGNAGGQLWQTNFKLPPGLSAGWHPVTVAIGNGPPSEPLSIAVDVPLRECVPHIEGVRDGTTWAADCLDLKQGRKLAVWCSGLPENADIHNVRVWVNGAPCATEFVGRGEGPQQVNVVLPEEMGAGDADVVLRAGAFSSAPVRLSLVES